MSPPASADTRVPRRWGAPRPTRSPPANYNFATARPPFWVHSLAFLFASSGRRNFSGQLSPSHTNTDIVCDNRKLQLAGYVPSAFAFAAASGHLSRWLVRSLASELTKWRGRNIANYSLPTPMLVLLQRRAKGRAAKDERK